MPQSDLILLHAPSVYDFRQETILYGPVSDLVPPSPVFELYPIGLTSIAAYLEVEFVTLAGDSFEVITDEEASLSEEAIFSVHFRVPGFTLADWEVPGKRAHNMAALQTTTGAILYEGERFLVEWGFGDGPVEIDYPTSVVMGEIPIKTTLTEDDI